MVFNDFVTHFRMLLQLMGQSYGEGLVDIWEGSPCLFSYMRSSPQHRTFSIARSALIDHHPVEHRVIRELGRVVSLTTISRGVKTVGQAVLVTALPCDNQANIRRFY